MQLYITNIQLEYNPERDLNWKNSMTVNTRYPGFLNNHEKV
jgi:hypothetical protein